MPLAATDSRQVVTLATRALSETLTLAATLGFLPGWIAEAELTQHWRSLMDLSGVSGASGHPRRRRSPRRSQCRPPYAPLPFGRPLLAVGVSAALGGSRLSCLPSYLLLNEQVFERASYGRLEPIYELVAAISMVITHVTRFRQRDQVVDEERPILSQVVVLARGGRFYLEPASLAPSPSTLSFVAGLPAIDR